MDRGRKDPSETMKHTPEAASLLQLPLSGSGPIARNATDPPRKISLYVITSSFERHVLKTGASYDGIHIYIYIHISYISYICADERFSLGSLNKHIA